MQDPTKAILSDKNDLECLVLECRYPFRAYSQSVLGMLKSHTSLKELTIKCYGGTRFPSWVGDPSFSNIVMITLESCTNCRSLPSLGLLCSLKALTIREMTELKIIGSEIYGDGCSKPFQSLETLCFRDLQEWELWDPIGKNEYVESFPLLRELSIVKCPKLSGRLPDHLPSLKKLVISECAQFEVSFASLPVLSDLSIDGCKGLVCGSLTHSKSLNSVTLSNISDSGDWSTESFQKVEYLKVVRCEELIYLWQNEIWLEKTPIRLHGLTSPKKLCIENCQRLVSFQEVCFLPILGELEIKNCSALKFLPEGMKHNNVCLECLLIEGCNSLKFVVKGQLLLPLKKLQIRKCEKLKHLLDDRGHINSTSTSIIKYLCVSYGPSLTCLSSTGQNSILSKASLNCREVSWRDYDWEI